MSKSFTEKSGEDESLFGGRRVMSHCSKILFFLLALIRFEKRNKQKKLKRTAREKSQSSCWINEIQVCACIVIVVRFSLLHLTTDSSSFTEKLLLVCVCVRARFSLSFSSFGTGLFCIYSSMLTTVDCELCLSFSFLSFLRTPTVIEDWTPRLDYKNCVHCIDVALLT